MYKKQKPNILFWSIVISLIILTAIAVYGLILILMSDEPLFSRANSGNLCSIATWLLFSLIAIFMHKFHREKLYGFPGDKEENK